MAKALFGYVASPADAQLQYEVRRLRMQVARLEDELARARDENDRLGAELSDSAHLLPDLVEVSDEALTTV